MSFFQGLLLTEVIVFFLTFEKDNNQKPGHEPAPAFSTYSVQPETDKPIEAEINGLLEAFEKPQLEEKFLVSDWLFAPGDHSESIIADYILKPKDGVFVNLPHQFPEPDSVLWYSKIVQIAEPSIMNLLKKHQPA